LAAGGKSDGELGMMTVIDLVAYLYYNPHMSAKKKKFAGGKT
jgi:hypothetical protein